MIYRSVGNRVAVDWQRLRLPINADQTLSILEKIGFKPLNIDITAVAKGLIGNSQYQRGARPEQAPQIVDCSSMVKWIYGQLGIWLPRYSIDQHRYGRKAQKPKEGDLVFTKGYRSYYWDDPNDGVGHVGIMTSEGTVVHAASSDVGITESGWEEFCSDRTEFRGIRRYLPPHDHELSVLLMTQRQVETSQELRWLILQHL